MPAYAFSAAPAAVRRETWTERVRGAGLRTILVEGIILLAFVFLASNLLRS